MKWLTGSTDADLFMLLEPGVPIDRLDGLAHAIGSRVLEGARRKYAQHPYIVGTFEELRVDLVPAYAVEAAHDKMSAVDRTPFHTAWVNEHLSDAQKADVRLAKQWCKGVGVYGAETAIGGLSGYLIEVLVGRLGSFNAFIDWLASPDGPHPLPDDAKQADDGTVLLVIDPVDSARNCAAAVRDDTLALAVEAARSWQAAPAERFLFPVPVEPEPVQRLSLRLRDAAHAWAGLELRPATDRLDLVVPQFQRAARMLCEAMERVGFTVVSHRVDVDEDRPWVGMQWLLDGRQLPATVAHEGPPTDQEPNASRFRKKWQDHADVDGGIIEHEGRLRVRIKNRHRTAGAWLAANLSQMQLPKHVQACIATAHVHNVPSVPSPWAPSVTAFIQGMRPWQRT